MSLNATVMGWKAMAALTVTAPPAVGVAGTGTTAAVPGVLSPGLATAL
jgi:hypothetical protein